MTRWYQLLFIMKSLSFICLAFLFIFQNKKEKIYLLITYSFFSRCLLGNSGLRKTNPFMLDYCGFNLFTFALALKSSLSIITGPPWYQNSQILGIYLFNSTKLLKTKFKFLSNLGEISPQVPRCSGSPVKTLMKRPPMFSNGCASGNQRSICWFCLHNLKKTKFYVDMKFIYFYFLG